MRTIKSKAAHYLIPLNTNLSTHANFEMYKFTLLYQINRGVYVCMYIYIYVYMCIYTFVCIYIYTYIFVYIYNQSLRDHFCILQAQLLVSVALAPTFEEHVVRV